LSLRDSAGSPACNGAPWLRTKRRITSVTVSTSRAAKGRIETTSGPPKRPGGTVSRAEDRPLYVCR